MKIFYLIIIIPLLFCNILAGAQAKKSTQTKTQTPTVNPITKASDSIKMEVNDVKNSFSVLFAGKKDTVTIQIENIDYDNPDLSALKENLKSLKSVKSESMQYKSGNATIAIACKGHFTDLWDQLPPASKAPFKIVEAEDKSADLLYKNGTTTNK